MSGSDRGDGEQSRGASKGASRETAETKPAAEGPADQEVVDRDSEGVYYMSVEDFERRRPPRPRPDDGRRRR